MSVDTEKREAQLKSLTCLADLKEQFKDQLVTVFLINEEEKAKLEEIFRNMGFFGPNSQINTGKDALLFRLNDKEEPGLFYIEDVEGYAGNGFNVLDGKGIIGIVGNSETEELEFCAHGADWRFEMHHKGVEGMYDSKEAIEFADCMVDIVYAQL